MRTLIAIWTRFRPAWVILGLMVISATMQSSYHVPTHPAPKVDLRMAYSAMASIGVPDTGESLEVSCGEYNVEVVQKSTGLIWNVQYVANIDTAGLGTARVIHAWASAHHMLAWCTDGKLRSKGFNDHGQCAASGSTISNWTVCKDSLGNDFPRAGLSVIDCEPNFTISVVTLSNDSVYAAGDLSGYQRGLPVYSGSTVTNGFVNIPFPEPMVKAGQGQGMIALAASGTPYTWGGNGYNLSQGSSGATIKVPTAVANMTDSCDDILPMYLYCTFYHTKSGHVWGSGFWVGFMGIGAPGDVGNKLSWYQTPYGGVATAIPLDSAGWPKINVTASGHVQWWANSDGVFVIDTRHHLRYMGDYVNGCDGIGIEARWQPYYIAAAPHTRSDYEWDQQPGDVCDTNANTSNVFSQRKFNIIGAGTTDTATFDTVGVGPALTYHVWARTADGQWWSWGRGKAGYLGDQRYFCDHVSGTTDQNLPNSRDRIWPTQVFLDSLFKSFAAGAAQYWSPSCLNGLSGCPSTSGSCALPSAGTPGLSSNPFSSAGDSIVMNLTNYTNTKPIAQFMSRIDPVGSAPMPPMRAARYQVMHHVANGTYQYSVMVMDGASDSTFTTYTVVVNNSGGGSTVTVNAGTDQSLGAGTTTATLSGSASTTSGSITTYLWTQISGSSRTITSASSASTTVTGMTAGTYIFNLHATDSNGSSGDDQVQVTIAAFPGNSGKIKVTRSKSYQWIRN